MTVRNLDYAFAPRSIALVGASAREGSVGHFVLRNVLAGGFSGAVYPINPKYAEIEGIACYRRAADLPEAPDLAVIMTPPDTVPRVTAELGARGVKTAVVITAGVDAASGLRQQMLDAARPYLMRIIGPNTIGLVAPHSALNASFAHIAAQPGHLGMISQSGAIVSSIIDWAAVAGVGFSEVLSLGDMADVDVGDCLNMLATDPRTSSILMYLESIPAPRKFMSAARAAARVKPVIAVKPGRHAAAAKAAATHTGALAGADRVVDAALRRAGVIRGGDLEDLFTAAEITARFPPLERGRVAIVTNGGGAGVLAVDQLLDNGCELAALDPATLEKLNALMPANWSRANPVDIIGDAPPERYRQALELVAADPSVDAVLMMNCPTALASPQGAAETVAGAVDKGLVNGKPVLACWLGAFAAEPARSVLRQAGVASFATPAEAAKAVAMLTRWSAVRRAMVRVPESQADESYDRGRVEAIIGLAVAEKRTMLTEPEAKALLGAYGIPVPEVIAAVTGSEVEAAAARLLQSFPAVVVKLLSRTITHKSDVGGVALGLGDPGSAGRAAAEIRARVEAKFPGAVDGFSVQPMIQRPDAQELIVGMHQDPIFGPTILFGAGGTAAEVIDDVATGLAPLDDVLAGDLIDRTRVGKLLAGYRNEAPADRSAILRVLTGLSQLTTDFPAIVAVDINPLLADAAGAVALDARVQIDPARLGLKRPNPDLAVRPYPSGWESRVEAAGRPFVLRPIRPADAELYPAFLAKVTPEDLRLRFLTPMRTIGSEMLIRLTQLDYDRDIAFVALEAGSGELAGIVRYSADPDHEAAEFGVLVRSDLHGLGLGTILLRRLIEYGRADGLKRLDGVIFRENQVMLALCRDLGFAVDTDASNADLVRAQLDIAPPA
jgi:acetyltransferase